jgi:hypothetical protein
MDQAYKSARSSLEVRANAKGSSYSCSLLRHCAATSAKNPGKITAEVRRVKFLLTYYYEVPTLLQNFA